LACYRFVEYYPPLPNPHHSVVRWKNPPNALEATAYVYDNYVNQTTGMAKMNPGLDVHVQPVHPNITGTSDPGLIDYIVKQRLFNFWLEDGRL
jgi:hypothetical protein